MKIGLPKETLKGENRVALDPATTAKLIKKGFTIQVEKDAGQGAFHHDGAYKQAGATIVDTKVLWSTSDIILKVNAPTLDEATELKENAILIGLLNPHQNQDLIQKLTDKKITAFALEMLPRISRAQSMDVLSSQASLAGYKAVLIAASTLGKYFPMLTTAAGTMAPSKILVVGAGVAGLQAIATAKRLGSVVEAYDIRAEVKEQIQSLGAKFVEVEITEDTATKGGYAKEASEDTKKKIQQTLAAHVAKSDVVITTAQIPGRKAPRIITEEMVNQMKPGSVIVDLAADQGGNSAYSKPGETVVHKGVTLLGPVNIPATLPIHASQMFAKNISTFLLSFIKDGKPFFDFGDDVIKGACVTHEGVNRMEKK